MGISIKKQHYLYVIFGINTTCEISKLSQISCNNFEILLVVFMPNITTNHAITDTNFIDAKKVFSDTISITASSLWFLIRSQNDIISARFFSNLSLFHCRDLSPQLSGFFFLSCL